MTSSRSAPPRASDRARSGALMAEGLGIRTGDAWLLREATWAVASGALTCVVGPNGAGKSTLLRALAGLLVPAAGRVSLDDRPIDRWDRPALARRMTMVPQSARPAAGFTVREVVAMGRYAHGEPAHRAFESPAVLEALRRADVEHLATREVQTLSGGEHQRVLLARCLASEAPILLLDEPTSALDLRHALQVMTLSRDLASEGKTVVMALHDLAAALQFADQAVVLSDGRIVAQGPPTEVLTPERIESVFGVRAEPIATADGRATYRFHPRP